MISFLTFSLPKPLKHVMKLCVKEGVDNCSAQEISASLGTALQHGLGGMESLDLSNHDLQKLVVGLKVHVYLRVSFRGSHRIFAGEHCLLT